MADEDLSPEDDSFAFGGTVIITTKEIALLLESKLTLRIRLTGEVQLIVDEAKWRESYPLVKRSSP